MVRRKSKKGISILIGYVLLVTFAVIIGVVVYKWMKTYVPQEDPSCPDGTTLFIEEQNYNCETNILTFKIVNNGNFDIGGYFIYGTDADNKELATIELARSQMSHSNLTNFAVKFGSLYDFEDRNSLAPGESEVEKFNLTAVGRIYSIEIIPFRWQTKNRKVTLISCDTSKLQEEIECFIACTPDDESVTCYNLDCGTTINNCGDEVDCEGCTDPQECNILGKCVDASECKDSCSNPLDCCEGLECGSVCGEVCGGECPDFTNGDGVCPVGNLCVLGNCFEGWENCDRNDANGCETPLGTVDNCGDCGDDCGTEACVDGYCETPGSTTCDGVWNIGEEDVDCDGASVEHCTNCNCDSGYAATGDGDCEISIPNTVTDCGDYCNWLGYSGVNGDCKQNQGVCNTYCGVTGTIEAGGSAYCGPPPTPVNCCCCP